MNEGRMLCRPPIFCVSNNLVSYSRKWKSVVRVIFIVIQLAVLIGLDRLYYPFSRIFCCFGLSLFAVFHNVSSSTPQILQCRDALLLCLLLRRRSVNTSRILTVSIPDPHRTKKPKKWFLSSRI
jgi:hypothetical protein